MKNGYRRSFSPEFRLGAVRLVTESGRPLGQVAPELELRPDQVPARSGDGSGSAAEPSTSICASAGVAKPVPAAWMNGRKSSRGIGKIVVEVVLGRDLGRSLQIAKLERARLDRERTRRLCRLRGLQLALGADHLGSPLPLRFGLARHHPLHTLGEVQVLDLDGGDLDPPGVSALVDDAPEDSV